MTTTIKNEKAARLIPYSRTEKSVLGVLILAAVLVVMLILYWKQPVENQEAALAQIALYTKEVVDMPLSDERTDYLSFTKHRLEAGKLTNYGESEIKNLYESAIKASEGEFANQQIKHEILKDIDAAADLPKKQNQDII